MKTCRFYHNW